MQSVYSPRGRGLPWSSLPFQITVYLPGGRVGREIASTMSVLSVRFRIWSLLYQRLRSGSHCAGPAQWLPDLKRWYSSDQIRKRTDKTDMVDAISRPTRPPGKYTVIWNGKDDHGKPLPRGEYTLCIDAAREHGTYQ